MPTLAADKLPKYRKHKASGQAVVTLCGRDHYLGPHGTTASRLEYDRLTGEWMANGRRLPSQIGLTVLELISCYWKYAQGYYVKHGRPTDEQAGIRIAMRFLRESYGRTPVADFGPLALEAVQRRMVEAGQSRACAPALARHRSRLTSRHQRL
jgi:hypothetical protein